MFYMNDRGEVREAIKHTGKRTTEEIFQNLGVYDILYIGNYYFKDEYDKPKYEAADYFEKHWRPIRENRVRLAEKIFRLVLVELEKKQHKNDDWTKEDWTILRKWAADEFNELGRELYKFEDNDPDKSAENMRAEAAHLAIVAGMLADKADSVKELDKMWNKEGNNE